MALQNIIQMILISDLRMNSSHRNNNTLFLTTSTAQYKETNNGNIRARLVQHMSERQTNEPDIRLSPSIAERKN